MASTQITNKPQGKVGFATFCANPAVRQNISNVVGEKHTSQFIASVVSAVQTNKALAECTNSSIFSAALLGESLKLSPSPQLGQFYMVPYKDRKTGISEAQFQLGSKGYRQLAIRSGQYRKIVTSVIKQGELKSFNPIVEEYRFEPVLDPDVREKLPVIGYYASFTLVNGFQKELYWSKERMIEHAKRYSQGYRTDLQKGTQYTFWSKDFDAMAEKTMIRQLISKWGIMSIDMVTALETDNTIEAADGTRTYVELEDPDVAKLPEPEPEPAAVETAPEAPVPEEGGDLVW